MFNKVRNYDASSAPLTVAMFIGQFQTRRPDEVKLQVLTTTTEVQEQEKIELRRWVKSVQTHNRLRALDAVHQTPVA